LSDSLVIEAEVALAGVIFVDCTERRICQPRRFAPGCAGVVREEMGGLCEIAAGLVEALETRITKCDASSQKSPKVDHVIADNAT
jgi:hypothetical protein